MTHTWIAMVFLAGLASLAESRTLALNTGDRFITVRTKLYADGWRADPAAHASTGEYDGLDRLLVQAGYAEVDYCSVGKSDCVLQYTKGSACLRLHTQGEEIRSMKLERWTDECREKGPSEAQNLLPADVRYMAQWRNECADFEQCKGADAYLLRLRKKYAQNTAVMKILKAYNRPVEIYPDTKK